MKLLNNDKYHLTMLLVSLNKMQFPNKGDTRNYLDIDLEEHKILIELITDRLNAISFVERYCI